MTSQSVLLLGLLLCINTSDNCTSVNSISISPTTVTVNGVRTFKPAIYDLATGKITVFTDSIFKAED